MAPPSLIDSLGPLHHPESHRMLSRYSKHTRASLPILHHPFLLSPLHTQSLDHSVPLCPQTIDPTDPLITFSALNPLTQPSPVRHQHILPHHSLCPLTPQFLYLPVALPPLNLHPPLHRHSIFLRPQSLYRSRNTQSLNHPLPPFS